MFFDEVNAKDNLFIHIFYDKKVVCQGATLNVDLDLELAVHLQLMTPGSSKLFSARDQKSSRSLRSRNFPKNFHVDA